MKFNNRNSRNKKNKLKNAVKIFENAIELSLNTYLTRGLYNFDQGNYKQAQKDLTKYVKWRPNDVEINYYLGISSDIEGEYEKAIECFKKVIKQYSLMTQYHFFAAVSRTKIRVTIRQL